MASRKRKASRPIGFTISEIREAFLTNRSDLKPNTRAIYIERIVRMIQEYEPSTYGKTQMSLSAFEDVDVVPIFSSVTNMKKIRDQLTKKSKTKSVIKDYFQALSTFYTKISPETFGPLIPDDVKDWIDRSIKDWMSKRSLEDMSRSMSDDGHEPYTNIQAAGEWFRKQTPDKQITQDALIVSMYADNPVYVRDNYGMVRMDYGGPDNRKYTPSHLSPINPDTDTFYEVRTGKLFITEFKTATRGYRPYLLVLSDYTRSIIDRQLETARRSGDMSRGYRPYLFHAPSDHTQPIIKLGRNAAIDKAFRSTAVTFNLKAGQKAIGPNVLRSSYVTYRIQRPGVSMDELMALANDMKHSFLVQQVVYQRQKALENRGRRA